MTISQPIFPIATIPNEIMSSMIEIKALLSGFIDITEEVGREDKLVGIARTLLEVSFGKDDRRERVVTDIVDALCESLMTGSIFHHLPHQ